MVDSVPTADGAAKTERQGVKPDKEVMNHHGNHGQVDNKMEGEDEWCVPVRKMSAE